MAKKKRNVKKMRRMPRQEIDFFLDEDWEGWEFKADTYLPQGRWLEPIVEWEEQLAVLREEVERLQGLHAKGDVSEEEATEKVTGLLSRQTIILMRSRLHTKRVLEDVVVKWNFVDRDGEKLPLSRQGWDELPQALLEAMWFKYIGYITEPPKAGSG